MAMRIRELAAQTGTTTRTLRYYEAQGLLPTGRSANGYRVYDGHHVRLVREIRSLQAVGFSLEDVRPFVECLLAGHESGDDCPASVDVYRRKLAYLERHIAELQDVRDRLSGRPRRVLPAVAKASRAHVTIGIDRQEGQVVVPGPHPRAAGVPAAP